MVEIGAGNTGVKVQQRRERSDNLRILTLLLLLASIVSCATLTAGEVPDTSRSSSSDAVKIFIDCSYCTSSDFDYFKTEIGFVNFVRDRSLAEVDILFSSLQTGSGGTEHTLIFIGQQRFDGKNDTLTCFVNQSSSEESSRQHLLQVIKLGLMRYVAHTDNATQITIGYSIPGVQTPVVDIWKHWVFSLSGNGYFNGQKTYRSRSIWGSFSANRVTESLKLNCALYYSNYKDVFTTDEGEITSSSDSKEFEGSAIFSLTRHWSAGIGASIYSSSYSNNKLAEIVRGQVEYNLFPYSESTHRQLRFDYYLTFRNISYVEETIYNRTAQNLLSQSLSVTLKVIQPWGSAGITLSGSHYLHDFSKNQLQLYGDMSFRLIRGLSVKLSGSVSRVHNQLSLPKGGASDDQILLRRRELASSYNYYTSVGFSYSFGSIYSEIVNPRFGD